jgi:hypothetical protein
MIEADDQLCLSYGNRSAVYFAVKEYEKCLENIQLAKMHGYPTDKIEKLVEREEKCKLMMKQQQSYDSEDDAWNFFKLSYPANEKIPFIVDCLQMREDKKFGRGIFVTRDVKPGDVLCIEDVFLLNILRKDRRCGNCAKENMLNLIPFLGECKYFKTCADLMPRLNGSILIQPNTYRHVLFSNLPK